MRAVMLIPPAIADEIRSKWEAERSYYDSPHGAGSRDIHDAPPSWVTRGWGGQIRLGLSVGPEGRAMWLRSSGTWAALEPAYDGRYRLVVAGCRHALFGSCPGLPSYVDMDAYAANGEVEVVSCVTQRPDLPPWDTAT